MDSLSKSTKIFGLVIVLLVGLLIKVLIQDFMSPKKNNTTTKTEFKQEDFKSVKVGTSDLFIITPYKMTSRNMNIPQEMKDNLEKFEPFDLEKSNNLEGTVAYLRWKSGIDFSIENGTNAAIEKWKTMTGVEKVDCKREYFEANQTKGCFFNGQMIRYGKIVWLNGAVLKSGQDSWMITFLATDTTNTKTITQVIASLRKEIKPQ